MQPTRRAGRSGAWSAGPRVAVALAMVSLSGCTRSLIDPAIAARGGTIASLYREADARVFRGLTGAWEWETAYVAPDRFRWSLHTYGEDQSFVFDGQDVLLFLGSASLPADPDSAAGFRTVARWFAVSALDVLADPRRVELREIAGAELPQGVARGLTASFVDPAGVYSLYFDEQGLLIALEGKVALPLVGAGRLRAEYADFRDVDGYRLPFSSRYSLDGQPLAEESLRACIPNDPDLTAASLSMPQ